MCRVLSITGTIFYDITITVIIIIIIIKKVKIIVTLSIKNTAGALLETVVCLHCQSYQGTVKLFICQLPAATVAIPDNMILTLSQCRH